MIVADPIVRIASETYQLALVGWLSHDGRLFNRQHAAARLLSKMAPGRYAFQIGIAAGVERTVSIAVDAVIQPR